MTSLFSLFFRFFCGCLIGFIFAETGRLFLNSISSLVPYSDAKFWIEWTGFVWAPISILAAIFAAMTYSLSNLEQLLKKNTPAASKAAPLILDSSILMDGRLVDLAGSRLLDQRLILTKSVLKELEQNKESAKGLENVQKLEAIPSLGLTIVDDEGKSIAEFAQQNKGFLFVGDTSRLAHVDPQSIIHLNSLAYMLRPQFQGGEVIPIKIQRLGKEPKQGVGYLDDGSMVVVNGGAEFLGESIRVQVLSVKYTSNGRLVFCNVQDETAGFQPSPMMALSSQPSSYFVS